MAPSLANSYKTEINSDSTTTLVSPSFTPATGELLVAKAANSDASQTFAALPTVSGFTFGTWTQQVNVGTSGASCRAAIWTATVTSGGTAGTVSLAIGNAGLKYHALVVERWTSWQLDATPATVGVAGDTTSPWQEDITTEASGSVVSYVAADWTPSNPSGVSYSGDTATPTEEQTTTYTALNYAAYWLYQSAASSGANTIGLSAPSGMNLTTAAIEIQGVSSGTTANAGLATATGAALDATAAVTAVAGLAPGTGGAQQPSVTVADSSGPNYAGAASDLGGGSGSWTSPTNADGAPDSTYASWAVP